MGRRFLVTAGNTREPIDQVRDWGNVFTGNTGFAIATALLDLGDVTLLTSNREHATRGAGMRGAVGELFTKTFSSHADLLALCDQLITAEAWDAILMSAAVADYSPSGAYEIVEREATGVDGEERWTVRSVQKGKIASTHGRVAFTGTPTVKIIDQVRARWGYAGFLVKFKLEVGIPEEALREIAQASRRHSGADLMVANTLAMVQGEHAGAWLLSDTQAARVPRRELAGAVRDAVAAGIARK
jgi:phosphopantothenoylcysteine synthetase/decarboxylase